MRMRASGAPGRSTRLLGSALFAGLLALVPSVVPAWTDPPLTISSVGVDTVSDIIVIDGQGFKYAGYPSTPYVELGGTKLTVTSSSATEIIAKIPGAMDSG